MQTSLSVLVTALTVSAAVAQTPDDATALEAYVDGVVTAHMRQHGTPGVTVSVVRDGAVLFAKGYGLADIESGRPVAADDTLFRIGSVSKTFIWTSVMMLVERGQLDLATDVNEYLQGMQIPATFDEPVTLEHLMAHRAGFEMTVAVFTHLDATDMSVTDALVRDMPQRVNPPGVRTSYSNWGATLASKIVADAAGTPYEQFLQEEILQPLGMTETTLKGRTVIPPELAPKMSVGYETEGGAQVEATPMEIGPHAPAGAIASTAADMVRWMLVHLGGGALGDVRLVSETMHDLMWTRGFTDRATGADLAHGFMTKTYYGYDTYAHGGSTAAFYTNMVLVPDLGLGVFVSQNDTSDRGLVSDLPDLIIQRLAAADRGPGATASGADAAADAAACAGSYVNNRRSFTRFERVFSSMGATTVSAGDDGGLTVSNGGDATRYEPLVGAHDTYQDRFGNRVVFGRDASGAVTHFSGPWGVHSYERVDGLDRPLAVGVSLALVALFTVTTWMGMLWRRGVPPVRPTRTGRMLGIGSGLLTVVVLAFMGAALWTMMALQALDGFADYPPAAVGVFRALALAVFGAAIAAAASLWPAWRSSGWKVVRKLHHTLYALSLVALAVTLVWWNVVFAATAV